MQHSEEYVKGSKQGAALFSSHSVGGFDALSGEICFCFI